MAIAVGNTSDSKVGSAASSLTWAHNNDGNVLIVCIESLTGFTASTTTVTYNGVSMTQEVVGNSAGTDATTMTAIYSLANPASGSHNVVVTHATAKNFGATAISFTGANTSDPVGATGGDTSNTNSSTVSRAVTTSYDNSIVVDATIALAATTATVGSGQTQVTNQQIVSDGYGLASYETTTTAGSVTMSWSLSPAVNWNICVAEVREAVAEEAPAIFFGANF